LPHASFRAHRADGRFVGSLALELAIMNQHTKPPQTISPLAVTDPKIRVMLQLAGLRFMITRANWLISEATILGKALKAGDMTSEEVDAKLEEMGALDLCYPELMGGGE
jgi:hypothetical protein